MERRPAHEKEDKREFSTRDRVLAFTMIFGPVAALLNQAASYVLVPQSCASGSKYLLHIIAGVFAALCLISAFIARGQQTRIVTMTAIHERRAHWMAVSAVILSIAGAIVILAMEVPNVLLRSCQ